MSVPPSVTLKPPQEMPTPRRFSGYRRLPPQPPFHKWAALFSSFPPSGTGGRIAVYVGVPLPAMFIQRNSGSIPPSRQHIHKCPGQRISLGRTIAAVSGTSCGLCWPHGRPHWARYRGRMQPDQFVILSSPPTNRHHGPYQTRTRRRLSSRSRHRPPGRWNDRDCVFQRNAGAPQPHGQVTGFLVTTAAAPASKVPALVDQPNCPGSSLLYAVYPWVHRDRLCVPLMSKRLGLTGRLGCHPRQKA